MSLGTAGENAAATGDLDITANLTIAGASARTTIVSASGIFGGDRVFDIIGSSTVVTISGIAITGGDPGGSNGGGILSAGNLTLADDTVTGNQAGAGGGIANIDGTVTMTGSTVSNNQSGSDGAGILNGGASAALTLTNSTLDGNQVGAGTNGGGIENSGTATITNDTITGNTSDDTRGAGVSNGPSASMTLKNSLFASNTGGNCQGTAFITSGGHNLFDTTCSGLTAGSGDQTNVDPRIGSLANNGGGTDTRALQSGSPAIDTADNSGCPASDQRGGGRPQGGVCDIGGYEFGGLADLAVSKSGSPNPVEAGRNLTYAIQVTNNGPDQDAGTTVHDTLPTGVTLQSATADQGSCSGTSTVTCALGTLANGAVVKATIVVKTTSPQTISNAASVTGSATDPVSANDQATATNTVRDTTAPQLILTAPKKQRILRQKGVIVFVQCHESCTVTAAGRIPLSGASKLLRLKGVTRALAPNVKTKLKLKLSKKRLALVRRALAKRRHLTAKLNLSARDPSGNSRSARVKVKLRR